jgi:hypothetical protein
MSKTQVTPPAAAAAEPVPKSSFWVIPGSRKCTCTSMQPGSRCRPSRSISRAACGGSPCPTCAIRPPRRQPSPRRHAARSRPGRLSAGGQGSSGYSICLRSLKNHRRLANMAAQRRAGTGPGPRREVHKKRNRQAGDDRGVSIPRPSPAEPEDDAPVYDRLRADIIAGIYRAGRRAPLRRDAETLRPRRQPPARGAGAACRRPAGDPRDQPRLPRAGDQPRQFRRHRRHAPEAGTRGLPHLRREWRRRVGGAHHHRRPQARPRRQTLRRRYRQRGAGRLGTLPPRLSRGADRRLRLAHDAAFLRRACTTISTATGG